MRRHQKKNIAIDIDGVICDWQGHLSKLVAERLVVTEPYLEKYDQIWHVKDKKTNKSIANFAFDDWKDELHRDAPVLGNAVQVINDLTSDFNIFYVTARLPDQETNKWLTKHGFPGVLHFMRDKTDAPCSAIVDDYIHNLRAYEKKYRIAVCFTQEWNKNERFRYRIDAIEQLPQALENAGLRP